MSEVASVDSVLLVGFGGPTPGCCARVEPCPGEAWCFVDGVLGNLPGRAAHVERVAAHYRALDGFSPFNARTAEQARALEQALAHGGLELPVYCGFRHWRPYVREVLGQMGAQGRRSALCVVLAPHQSAVSWDWYLRVVLEAAQELGAAAPVLAGFVEPWWAEAGFLEAVAGRVREAVAGWEPARFASAELLFVAHAIPEPLARTSPYCAQFEESARGVARLLGQQRVALAYQSRSDDSAIPWTGPPVGERLAELAAGGAHDVVAVPIGFLADHVEVLYDLDVEAAERARELGLGWARAGTVGTHPAFIELLARRVANHVGC